MGSQEMESWRQRIDEVDREIVRLLNQRATLTMGIGRLKASAEQDPFVPGREREVVENVLAASTGPLKPSHLVSVYRELLSACRETQRPLRVAYLGPAATFSHRAALEAFGSATQHVPLPSIQDVFLEVQSGECDYGVVPVENSTEGPVHEALDMFVDSDLKVCSEVTIPVIHCLLARCTLEEVKTIYANPQAAAQCRRWLSQYLPGREVVAAVSTARAAELAAEDHWGAAIAPSPAAAAYGLQVLEKGIQGLASNYTRFLVLSPTLGSRPTGRDKTGIVFSIKDRVGALRDVVSVFADHNINLSSIQSRPSRRRAWDYVFFVEFRGHALEPRVKLALQEAEKQCVFLKVLGSWPVPAAVGASG